MRFRTERCRDAMLAIGPWIPDQQNQRRTALQLRAGVRSRCRHRGVSQLSAGVDFGTHSKARIQRLLGRAGRRARPDPAAIHIPGRVPSPGTHRGHLDAGAISAVQPDVAVRSGAMRRLPGQRRRPSRDAVRTHSAPRRSHPGRPRLTMWLPPSKRASAGPMRSRRRPRVQPGRFSRMAAIRVTQPRAWMARLSSMLRFNRGRARDRSRYREACRPRAAKIKAGREYQSGSAWRTMAAAEAVRAIRETTIDPARATHAPAHHERALCGRGGRPRCPGLH